MSHLSRLSYYRRIFASYLTGRTSQLTFWHERPAVNARCSPAGLGPYYMTFSEKADYGGPYDPKGIPLLNYRGVLGLQYNPIAIAQYGLGNYNRYMETRDHDRLEKFVRVADWLAAHLEPNTHGLPVWHHYFDWEYRTPLKAPWYSGLAQGQGLSVLVRAYHESGQQRYLQAAQDAFASLITPVDKGGVLQVDREGHSWIEEYLVDPPTHILNGFIWASWGLYDYVLATGARDARALFEACIETLKANLHRYDAGYWSLYEQSGTLLRMFASPFYHALHIVQLKVLALLTGEPLFGEYAEQWDSYRQSRVKRGAAFAQKVAFKLIYY